MKRRQRPNAFTLVELVMVIVIIGLLAAVVVPKFTDMRTEAVNAAEKAGVSAVISGIKLAHMANLAKGQDTYPTTLDSAANGLASETNPLFTNVIEDGVKDSNWRKRNGTTYEYVPTASRYVYDRTTGAFPKQ